MKTGPKHIDLNIQTITTKHQYNIDDMIAMFGERIEPAIYYEENNGRWSLKSKHTTINKCAKGLDMKKMSKLCRKLKNKDIKEAYRFYYGILLAPWVLEPQPQVLNVMYCADIDFSKFRGEIAQMIDSNDRVTETNV